MPGGRESPAPPLPLSRHTGGASIVKGIFWGLRAGVGFPRGLPAAVRVSGGPGPASAAVGTGAEPPVHATTITWTAGADLCQRHPWVQARLLLALRSQGRIRDFCAEVTWTDLASVRSLDLNATATLRAWLEGTPPLQAHDLSGLTGLKTLYLQGDVWFPAVPADLLFHTPTLESLDLSGNRK